MKMISNQAMMARTPTKEKPTGPLTMCESNAVRYMSGYVAVKLLKKYKRHSKHPVLQLKRRLYVKILESMKAEEQPGKPDSVSEYTTLWMEIIDRGGIYHINDSVSNS